MIDFIKGEIIQKNSESLIVVNGGIGFHIICDNGLLQSFPPIGETATIWTYMNVRENEISLYGFPAQEIKSLFELLITVSGIGPKVAGSIVASISVDAFALAVINNDYHLLTTIKGIGKKGAQRIVLELKDKLKKVLPDFEQQTRNNPASTEPVSNQHLLTTVHEAVAALMVLGYAESEANSAVNQALQKMQTKEPEINLNDLLKSALKHLSIL